MGEATNPGPDDEAADDEEEGSQAQGGTAKVVIRHFTLRTWTRMVRYFGDKVAMCWESNTS